MNTPQSKPDVDTMFEDREPTLDELFRSIASRERRHILDILYTRAPGSLSLQDLTLYLASDSDAFPAVDTSSDHMQAAFCNLFHTHIPILDAAGLIDYDPSTETVSITDHPAYEDTGIVEAITDDADSAAPMRDALFAALADPLRRTILDVLSHQFGPIQRETLARELLADERDIAESAVSSDAVMQLVPTLHHVHLPILLDAGLIEYDVDEHTVAYAGHPDLRVPWTHSVLESTFRQSITGEAAPDRIGEIEGREAVVSYGQSLCDRADDELFCMFTDTDLLEAGCFTRIRDAARRDVDVYLGTRDHTVREYVQENAPEVTLWEPNTTWVSVPAAGGRVGRLLLVDREAVMLGTLLEESSAGDSDEQAIIGDGATNTLVTMICQLLTPHLDRIDRGSEDIESTLPL